MKWIRGVGEYIIEVSRAEPKLSVLIVLKLRGVIIRQHVLFPRGKECRIFDGKKFVDSSFNLDTELAEIIREYVSYVKDQGSTELVEILRKNQFNPVNE